MRVNSARVAVLERARKLGLNGVSSGDSGIYTCYECGSQWESRGRYAWWPIRVKWSPRHFEEQRFFTHHGAQIGADGIEQRVFARFVRIGAIIISFGWRDEYR